MAFSIRSPSLTSLDCISQSRDFKVLVSKTLRGFVDAKNKSRHFFVGKILSLYQEDVEGSYAAQLQHKKSSAELGVVRTLLIDNYDSYTYNIYQELSVINGMAPVVVYNDTLSWEELYQYIYELRAFDNVVISPGPGTPTCLADIGICLRLLLECPDIPILGICLGHQALGYAHGARITHAPEPVHGRLSDIEHNNCELFFGIPSGMNSGFKVVRYHSLVVDPNSLPKELIPIAWASSQMVPLLGTSNFDSHLNGHPFSSKASFPMDDNLSGNVLMGIMHSSRPHYGLQFHPESIATSYGRQIFKNFADITRDYWFRRKSSSLNMELQHFVCNQMHITPLFQDFAKYMVNKSVSNGSLMSTLLPTKSRFLKLVWRKLKRTATQLGGAKNIFCELFNENRAADTFWLDSSSTEMSRARFSFMGGKGGPLWKQVTFRLSDRSCNELATSRGGYLYIEDAGGCATSTYLEDGFFSFLNQEMQSFCYDATDYEALPFDFCGGYVGCIGYDLKVECGVSDNRHKSRTPDACLFFADNLVVIDHHCDDVYLLSLLDAKMNLTPWLDDVEQKLMNMSLRLPINPTPPASVAPLEYSSDEGFFAEKSREQYIRDIGKCQKLIREGESYELCLTMQMKRRVEEIDPLTLYLDLRSRNPAPYAAWLDFSKEKLCICCSSPERFLRLDGHGILEAKPIKGTIGRGKSPEEDQLLKLQLQRSEKDQAENLMIVDLLRNDLGRVCEPGSVHVPHLMEVETYANIHTMVSTIRGKKHSNVSAVDCIRSAFPGGSMTGAPKLRSMEILDSLETCSRGVYSGCIGYLSYNRTFDLNIVIRTIVIHEGEASIEPVVPSLLFGTEDEYEETMLKARVPSTAVMQILKQSDLKEG